MVGVIEQMLKPSAVGVDEINPNRAKITLEPLERGFGLTLGNALRRTLLAAMGNPVPAAIPMGEPRPSSSGVSCLVAALVAWRSKNVLLTIVAGMAALILLLAAGV